MGIFACRDVSNAFEWMTPIREIVESTPFHCKVLLHPERIVGLMRIEYEGHNEQEVSECDLKLTSKIISFFETKGTNKLVLLPLEFADGAYAPT